jgi:hypothetical protein
LFSCVADTISKEYTSDIKAKVETVATNGVKVTANVVPGGDWDAQFKVPACAWSDVTAKLTSSGELTTETEVKNFGLAGAKAVIKSSHGASSSYDITGEYVQGQVAAKANFGVTSKVLTASVVAGPINNILAGVELSTNVAKIEPKIDATVSYLGGDSVVNVGSRKAASDLFVSFYKSFDKSTQLATEITYSLSKKAVGFSIGGSKAIDSITTVKAKYESGNNTGSLALIHKLRPNLAATFSGALDFSKKTNPTVGILLSFTD